MVKRRRTISKKRTTGSSYSDPKKAFRLLRSPAPRMFKTTLRYAEKFLLNPGIAGVAGVQVFRANGMFDPNVTGTGHQPRGFDQLMALYDHFVVSAAKITVHYASQNGEAVDYIVGITTQDDGTTSTDVIDYLERGYTVNTMVAAGAGASTKQLTMYSDTSKFLGRSDILSDPQLKGNAVGDPDESLIFHVFATSVDGTDTLALNCYCTIDYNAYFIEPKDVASS